MRNWLLVFGVLLIFSCNNSGPSAEDNTEDPLQANEELFPGDKLIWVTEYDTIKQQFVLRKQRSVNTDSLQAGTLINDINAGWEEVKLVFKKVSGDTLFVAIPESGFLTQRMGSSGAEAYISSTTYSLTELKGIKFISYEFEEGDHLSPGVYSREDFKDIQ